MSPMGQGWGGVVPPVSEFPVCLVEMSQLYFFYYVRPEVSSATTRKILEYCQGS